VIGGRFCLGLPGNQEVEAGGPALLHSLGGAPAESTILKWLF
jgi:hypothetical protein